MAFNPGGINLKFPLRKFRKGFFDTNDETISATREDIKTLLLTRTGERVINTGLGTNISVFAGELFEQIDKTSQREKIKNEIITALEVWMPHVKLVGIELLTKDDNPNLRDNDLLIEMDYVLVNAEALKDSIQLRIRA